jgi:hypothetical protein
LTWAASGRVASNAKIGSLNMLTSKPQFDLLSRSG